MPSLSMNLPKHRKSRSAGFQSPGRRNSLRRWQVISLRHSRTNCGTCRKEAQSEGSTGGGLCFNPQQKLSPRAPFGW
jgi:hypothetical protein